MNLAKELREVFQSKKPSQRLLRVSVKHFYPSSGRNKQMHLGEQSIQSQGFGSAQRFLLGKERALFHRLSWIWTVLTQVSTDGNKSRGPGRESNKVFRGSWICHVWNRPACSMRITGLAFGGISGRRGEIFYQAVLISALAQPRPQQEIHRC